MDADKKIPVEIIKMKPSDIEPVLNILSENNLEVWMFDDFISELNRLDSIALTVKTKDKTIGFCIARLITNHSSIPAITDGKKNQISDDLSDLDELSDELPVENFDAECEIYNIGVKKEFQNLGVGCKILTRLIRLLKEYGCRAIWLEVRKSNESAIGFYKKNAFKQIYERNNFYSRPSENAVVMKRDLQADFFNSKYLNLIQSGILS